MKSPDDIAVHMRRQWQRNQFRLDLLTSNDVWPMRYSIGLPTAKHLVSVPNELREHVRHWQQVSIGEVVWRDMNYRASAESIRMPSHWILHRPSDWVRASADRSVTADFSLLESLIDRVDSLFREPLILNLKLLQRRPLEELLDAAELASRLEPGEAQGRPLRLLAGYGVDTKFFERNQKLILRLLDVRFEGAASEHGLHGFLDAAPDGEHWLLMVPLQDGLLPFKRLQVRSQELASVSGESIKALNVLVVENRHCLHLLPKLDNTIAILGAGLDLDWLRANWLADKHIAYWGDIDTWGLAMLARARCHRPGLKAMLMDRSHFDNSAKNNAVEEPVTAGSEPPEELNTSEKSLYRWLLTCERGRLEQEYLPANVVHDALARWHDSVNVKSELR